MKVKGPMCHFIMIYAIGGSAYMFECTGMLLKVEIARPTYVLKAIGYFSSLCAFQVAEDELN